MLQRSQTLILLGAFVLNILLLFGHFATFAGEGEEYLLKHSGLVNAAGELAALATWPLLALVILVALLSFLSIFSYKNRMRQMRLCTFGILLSLGLVGMMLYYTWVAGNHLPDAHRLFSWRFVIPPVNMVLFYLAFRRIRRDDLLVKAFDRIR